jgi:hypothetical protein
MDRDRWCELWCENRFSVFAHGRDFDVDAFLADSTLTFDEVWRRADSLARKHFAWLRPPFH